MKIHFIGIGGIGISSLAQFCKNRGDIVTGSEMQKTGIYEVLQSKKIEVKIPQKAENVPPECDLVVYTEAIGQDNPELVEAKKRNLDIKTYFEFLGEISQNFRTIAVAGTHGKTTTTGLITAGFKSAQFDASVFVGSKLKELEHSNFHAGTNDFLLLEACEYRNNFRFLHPEIVLLTNVELDHVDFYKDEAHYLQTFSDFCDKAKVVIFHAEDENAKKVLQNFKGEKIAVPPIVYQQLSNTDISLSGVHNRQNAALALACAQHLEKDLSISTFKHGVQMFSGAWRRQEFLGERSLNMHDAELHKILIFDDYGHHPTEIKATLQSFREKFPNQPLGLIFEPHQFSRTKQFFREFLSAFELADMVGLFPIYAARDTEDDMKSVSLDDFLKQDENLHKVESQVDALVFAKMLFSFALSHPKVPLNEITPVLIFMGAGKIDVFAHEFVNS